MHGFVMLAVMSLALPILAQADDLDNLCWTQQFTQADPWTPQPKWLSHPSPTATVTGDGTAICFAVDEPGRGMKWSAPLSAVSLAEQPYLVLRYRSENLNTASTDYLVYLDDQDNRHQLHALRLCDVLADGQWHTTAVDMSTLTNADAIVAMAIQVQANRQGKGRLWLQWLSFRGDPLGRRDSRSASAGRTMQAGLDGPAGSHAMEPTKHLVEQSGRRWDFSREEGRGHSSLPCGRAEPRHEVVGGST